MWWGAVQRFGTDTHSAGPYRQGVAPEGLEEGDDGDDGHDDHDRYLSSQRAGARVHAFTHPALRRCAQSRPALWDPMSWSPPGSSVLGISQQGFWSGLPVPPLGDLPDPGIDPLSPTSPALQVGSLLLCHCGVQYVITVTLNRNWNV